MIVGATCQLFFAEKRRKALKGKPDRKGKPALFLP